MLLKNVHKCYNVKDRMLTAVRDTDRMMLGYHRYCFYCDSRNGGQYMALKYSFHRATKYVYIEIYWHKLLY